MVGDRLKLTIEQICLLSGLSEREVHKAINKQELLDQSPSCVGEWLIIKIADKLSKPKTRIGLRLNRNTISHRKWD
jgi:hypothetical protein